MASITKEMNVADIIDRFPGTKEVFRRRGFSALMNPVWRATLGKVTTVERGCRLHQVDLVPFLAELNQATEGPQSDGKDSPAVAPGPRTLEGRLAALDTASLIRQWPSTRRVFVVHFGEGCFDCPAFGTESVAFACSMHGTDLNVFIRECVELMEETLLTLPVMIIAQRFPASVPVLQEHRLDRCCGGQHSLGDVLNTHGGDANRVLQTLLKEILAVSSRVSAHRA